MEQHAKLWCAGFVPQTYTTCSYTDPSAGPKCSEGVRIGEKKECVYIFIGVFLFLCFLLSFLKASQVKPGQRTAVSPFNGL